MQDNFNAVLQQIRLGNLKNTNTSSQSSSSSLSASFLSEHSNVINNAIKRYKAKPKQGVDPHQGIVSGTVISTGSDIHISSNSMTNDELMKKYNELRAKVFIRQYLRTRFFNAKASYFSYWKKVTIEYKNNLQLSRNLLRQKVQEHSELTDKKVIETLQAENEVLKKTLLASTFFLRWKQRSLEIALENEREKFAREREYIRRELLQLRLNMQSNNEREVAVFESALLRGKNIANMVYSIQDHLS
jgi:hypothetical protein